MKLNEQLNRIKELSGITEANKTPCQTSGAQFHVKVEGKSVSISVDLPMDLDLTESEAKILETNMHNAMELVLAPYFVK